VDSAADAAPAADALDGDPDSVWRTDATDLPHTLTVDTHNSIGISGLTYLPPAEATDGRIGQYRITTSANGTTWSAPIATGTFADDAVLKTATFSTVITRFVRLTAVTEAGDRGSAVGAAEVNLLGGIDPALPRTGWTVAADSQETVSQNDRATNVLDGNTATFWHTAWSGGPDAPLPHRLVVDMHAVKLVSGLSYLPRQGSARNGTIGRYTVETSMTGTTWAPITASGTFADIGSAQNVTFNPALARFVRLTALTEAGGRGPWSSAAEINLLGRPDPTLVRTGWTATADSTETVRAKTPASNVLDGKPGTLWHTRWSAPAAPLPHTLTLDMKSAVQIGGLSYLPRPAASKNGRIGRYTIESSVNGTTWSARVTNGAFADNPEQQTVVFPPVAARYLRLIVRTEAGGRGPWTSVAEIKPLGVSGSVEAQRGTWGAPVGFPLVPVAAAQLPNGKILTWSSYAVDRFTNGPGGRTVTATFDPVTRVVTQRTITETRHDMFCPGISALPDGRIIVTGGNNSTSTSIYNPATDAWTAGPAMRQGRGYQASATLSDGRVFTIGGSWSGGVGGVGSTPRKAGEVWSAANGWTALPGASVLPMLTADANPNGDYRKDNHAWLFAWSNGTVLQAGPSRAMNWYSTDGAGSVTPAGIRGDDTDAMNGNAVMFDAGKILTIGGARSYEQVNATANAYVLTIKDSAVTARKVAPMANTRAFHNSVVLPDGKVAVFGGQNFPAPFSDNTAVLNAEMWDPVTERFTTMAPAAVPRVYHSVALLMPDGRVFTGGGGLCATCATNHFNAEIFTPPYLLNADGSAASRPAITDAPSNVDNGAEITVGTNRAVKSFAIIRMGTATHSVDTDQRRISLKPTAVDGGYRLTIPADPGVAVPGYWMLFAMDAHGVPSVAKTIRIG
jgi:galactose oxidase